ncbi:MAG: hypothetical protein ACRCWW_14370 [Scandinavium sp.]|uniref:hypothetical protein n=1 Tax=Scandinavium sp. TaxID=2830653 RepID=UPI003F2CDD06
MKIDFDVSAAGVDVSTSGYRDHLNLEVRGVEISDLLSSIDETVLFDGIDLEDYIDWADGKGKAPDVLGRLDADEVIAWLRSNGHLEEQES